MRHLALVAFVALAPSLLGDDVPQAVAALAHLKPRTDVGPSGWTAGPYQYDGAGNITAVGSEAYVYDKVGRLTSATLRGPDLSALQTQTFGYDVYGNLTSTSKLGQTVLLPTTAGTNRLETLGYDACGNVITAGTLRYGYDAVGMLNTVHAGTAAQPRIIYAYTADDERLFAFDVSTGTTHWTLRGLDNKVLRDFKQTGPTWSVERDYVYRDGLLLAALKPGAASEHYTLDHLGTPRLITDASGHKVGYHVYWPFGEEWSPGTAQEGAPLKFTGHERDADPTGGTTPLDYMHARYYAAGWGRFVAVDPVWSSSDLGKPQSWNRYAYVLNNPVGLSDPTGKVWQVTGDSAAIEQMQQIANSGLFGQELTITNGTANLVRNGSAGPPSPRQQALADTLQTVISDTATTTTAVVSDHPGVFIGRSLSRDGTMASPQAIDAGDIARIGPGPATTGAAILGHEVFEQHQMQTKGADYNRAHAAGIARENAIAGSTRLDANASAVASANSITFTVRYEQNGSVIPFRIQASLLNGLVTGVEPRP